MLCVPAMINQHETMYFSDPLGLPKSQEFHEIFIRGGWNPFLTTLYGHDDEVSLQFSLGFDENRARIGPLDFSITEESISQATGFP